MVATEQIARAFLATLLGGILPHLTWAFSPLGLLRDLSMPSLMPTCYQRHSTMTRLGLFWFGGKDDEPQKRKGEGAASFGFGGVAQVMDSMENFKKAQQVGKITESILQDLASLSVEGSAEDGKVRVSFDGTQRPTSVEIDEAFMNSVQVDDLNSALTIAMKDAHSKSKEKMEEKMRLFYAELGLSGSPKDS